MSLDVTTDPVLEVIGSLVTAHVNGELAATLEQDAIAKAYRHPTPLRILSAIAMPALSIARGEMRGRRRTAQHVERLVPVLFTYVTPPIALDRLELRWPLLQNVWELVEAVMMRGKSAHYMSGADVFTAAGVVEVVELSSTKREIYADTEGGTAYPAFEARIDIWTRELDDTEYDDLESILATYNLVGTVGETDVPAIVRDLIIYPARVVDHDEDVEDDDETVTDG